MPPFEEFDAVTVEHLRALGGLKWSLPGEAGLGAWVAEMDFGTAPPITAALHAAVDRAAFGYLPPALAAAAARACAHWYRDRYGWQVPSRWIHPLPDVLKGLEVAIEHFSPAGAPVILPTPAYMPFLEVPGLLGRDTIEVPMVRDGPRWTHDLDGLDAAFRAGGRLLVLTNPHNPLGRVFSAAELGAVDEIVERHGGRVFSDEIHAPLTYPGHRHVPYASISRTAATHAVTATSASKAWNLPGLKCAQLILSNEPDAALFSEVGYFASHGASTLGVVANTAAYEAGGPWLAEVLAYLDHNRRALAALLAQHLPGVRYSAPEGTYLAWLDVRELGLGAEPARVFRERAGVVLTEGAACGAPGRGHVRLNFATPRPVLERMVSAMASALPGA